MGIYGFFFEWLGYKGLNVVGKFECVNGCV